MDNALQRQGGSNKDYIVQSVVNIIALMLGRMTKRLFLILLMVSLFSCKREPVELANNTEVLCESTFNIADSTKAKSEDISLESRVAVSIPVVFHVVYNTPEQNISDAQILSQIDVLNEDFNSRNLDVINVPSAFQFSVGKGGIRFVMAQFDPSGNPTNGITRTYSPVTSFSSSGNVCFTSLGGHDAWNTAQYLNIWVCNKSGAAGYATYPWSGNPLSDGVIVKYTYVGRVGTFTNNWNYQRGRTITHEVGHWLGLIHIWGDAPCGDDLVADTPTQGAANGSCPTFPHITCSNSPNGDMFMNYMDYTYDACRVMFTVGQTERMNYYLSTTRLSLLSSPAIVQ